MPAQWQQTVAFACGCEERVRDRGHGSRQEEAP
jgi:hypothetical protein